MKKRILIINRSQFGYHIDTYFYCKYLRLQYDITYLCWDYEKPKIGVDGVSVQYISRDGSKFTRYMRFLRGAIKAAGEPHDLIFLKYFMGCFLLKLRHPRKKYIFDIRTLSINYKPLKRILVDGILRLESLLFANKTIISQSLADKLGYKRGKVHILPLGSDSISGSNKNFDNMRLLYVGTLHSRNIDQTILGFAKFWSEHKNRIKCNYKIIGSGYAKEENELKRLIDDLQLEAAVEILGRIPHAELAPYFDEQNIGISYIPITDHFDCQPPTKTFEYIMSGMPVVATNTSENRRIICPENGILIDDNPDSFYQGLLEIYQNRHEYSSERIRKTCENYTWKNIVEKNLIPYLEKI